MKVHLLPTDKDSKIRINLEVITNNTKSEFTIAGYMLHKPTIGSIFRLHDKVSNEFIFSTLNPVIEIEDELNFKTEKCSYRFYLSQSPQLNLPDFIDFYPLSPILAKIEHINDLGKSKWYEIVYYDNGWHSYAGSKTFQDGEQVVEWKYCKDCL